MAASRPAIDPDEGLAALFQRAHVGARRASSLLLQPQLQDLENVYDLLEAVRSGASAASLGISARDFERICDCALPALRSAEAAAAALALFACPSSHDGPSGLAAGGQAGGSAAAGGARGLGAEGGEGYTSGEEEAAAAAASSSEEQFGPRPSPPPALVRARRWWTARRGGGWRRRPQRRPHPARGARRLRGRRPRRRV